MGRPGTMCPRTNFLEPQVPKLIVPEHIMFRELFSHRWGDRSRNKISLHWYIPVSMKMNRTTFIGWSIMTGMHQCRDIVFPGWFILGTRGPRKFVQAQIVWERRITSSIQCIICINIEIYIFCFHSYSLCNCIDMNIQEWMKHKYSVGKKPIWSPIYSVIFCLRSPPNLSTLQGKGMILFMFIPCLLPFQQGKRSADFFQRNSGIFSEK